MPANEPPSLSAPASTDAVRNDFGSCLVANSRWLLAVLFLLCLVPRLLMGGLLSEVCDDSYYYIAVAHAVGDGDYESAFAYLNLNVYPLILLGLRRLGIEWVAAGQLWGILVSSLTILPLFGWVRRLFDDRVAAAACFLFAVHGSLIELSAEPIRESTFWFAVTLCLYLSRRAISEARPIFYVLAGLSLSVALHTRTEAFLLALPMAGWWIIEAFRRPDQRGRLCLGAAAGLTAAILFVVVLNVTVLRGHDRWEFGKFHHFHIAWQWLQSRGDAVHPSIAAARSDARASPLLHSLAASVDASTSSLLADCLKDLFRAVEPLHLWMLLAGLFGWRRTLRDPEKAVLLLAVPLLLAAIWVRLSYFGDSNSRYFLTLIFFCIPYMGLGLLWACDWTARAVGETAGRRFATPAVKAILLVFLGVGATDALIDDHPKREMQLRMGHWLRQQLDSPERVTVDYSAMRLGYATAGDVPDLTGSISFLQLSERDALPDAVILSVRNLGPAEFERILSHAESIGFERIGDDEFPRLAGEYCVLTPAAPDAGDAGTAQADASHVTRR